MEIVVGATACVRCMEVVRISECPLLDVSLYWNLAVLRVPGCTYYNVCARIRVNENHKVERLTKTLYPFVVTWLYAKRETIPPSLL